MSSFSETSEKSIERYLTNRLTAQGGVALKYSNPYIVGFPDRLCLLPGGIVFWVELKSRGKKPAPIQLLRHEYLRNLGQRVYVVDSKPRVDRAIQEVLQTASTSPS